MVLPRSSPARPAARDLDEWRTDLLERIAAGARFGGMYGTDRGVGCELTVLLTTGSGFESLNTRVDPAADGTLHYPALARDVPAAFWYERALHDLSGVVPDDHPRLDPLLLALPSGAARPRPGRAGLPEAVSAEDRHGPVDVAGHVFTLPFGPVRSGVMESIELLLETPGEDIPHLNIRPHYKHRGVAKQFERRSPDRGVLVAERVEGISSVAHALAYCHAVESLAEAEVPVRAGLIRLAYAELERIANHLDATMRLCDAAGLAVATARFAWHKEVVQRLMSRMCGNRLGRGVVIPGGVTAAPAAPAEQVSAAIGRQYALIHADLRALENSASFLDRLRGTGPLPPARAREHGALGPIGRASGFDDDDRRHRPYDGYRHLPAPDPPLGEAGDALARTRVRWHEIATSASLVRLACEATTELSDQVRIAARPADGFAVGWAEGAQGEELYGLELADGMIRRCFARSASFHNLVLLHDVFAGDIFTDLPFIEASFALGYAGVAM